MSIKKEISKQKKLMSNTSKSKKKIREEKLATALRRNLKIRKSEKQVS